MVFSGIHGDYIPGCRNIASVMAYGDLLTVLFKSGKLQVLDLGGESGFTPAEDTVFKCATICKGTADYFYAIDEDSALHRFRGMTGTTVGLLGWTEIRGDSVAYGIRHGMLYRVDPEQNNGAPQKIGSNDNWIHAWPLRGGKVVALAYA